MNQDDNMHLEKAALAVIHPAGQTSGKQKTQKQLLEDAASALRGNRPFGVNGKKMETALGSGFRFLTAQYNPASLSFSVSGENTKMESSGAQEAEEIVQQESSPLSVSLSVELVAAGSEARTRINGILGMLGAEQTRQVIFCWGNMVFPGQLTDASASYQMFSDAGEPLLGKLNLTIRQESEMESDYWEKAFERLFVNRTNRWKNT